VEKRRFCEASLNAPVAAIRDLDAGLFAVYKISLGEQGSPLVE
jgi:hypothetical protein